jgi:hypothetical protein
LNVVSYFCEGSVSAFSARGTTAIHIYIFIYIWQYICPATPYFYEASRSYASSVSSALVLERVRGCSCKAMPDIGNPEHVAGLCWWVDYSALLAEVGLLDQIRKGRAPGTYAFGDYEQRPALFRLLQVPHWYKSKAQTARFLFFSNVTIIDNSGGLLHGKMDQSALRLKVELRVEPGKGKFLLLGRQIEVECVASNFG